MSKDSDSDDNAKDSIFKNDQTVWQAWEPECDACGRRESWLKHPKEQLLSCAGCLVAKYCSKECQKKDWSKGHKSQCHLYEANRKLSSVFAKSLGPGTINDPKLSLAEKLCQWNFLNIHNHIIIAAAALKNDDKFAGTANVALLLSLAKDRAGSKYENRTFFIDKVLLLDRDASNAFAKRSTWKQGLLIDSRKSAGRTDHRHFKLFAGWCSIPGEKPAEAQMWTYPCSYAVDKVLPPGFDLNRFVTHVNRGITHFHASFWPLPRNISDADIETAEVPEGWWEYAATHSFLLSGLKGGQGIIGIVRADGTREPVYKFSNCGHFRTCAPGETDTVGPAEFKKPLVDPSKMVRLISKHIEILEHEQQLEVAKNSRFHPTSTIEEAKKLLCPGRGED